jgi:hypothetical protein
MQCAFNASIYAPCPLRSNVHISIIRNQETNLLLDHPFPSIALRFVRRSPCRVRAPMASRGRRLCILIALVGVVLAAPTASMADATWTGTRRHHLAPAPAPAGRSSATPLPVPQSKAPAAHASVSTARSPGPVPSEGPTTLAPSSPRDEATIPPSSVAT